MKKLIIALMIFSALFNLKAYAVKPKNVSRMPFKRSIDFIKWYIKNRKLLYDHDPINAHPGDSTQLYKLDYKQLNYYLISLKKSGYISNLYLDLNRIYYQQIAKQLLENPQWDGPINGFEVDPVLQIMETDDLENNIHKTKLLIQKVEDCSAIVLCQVTKDLKFKCHLTKSKGIWLVDLLIIKYDNHWSPGEFTL